MITSSSNSKIKHVCQLVTKAKARRTEQLFVVEGIRMAKEAPKELLKEVYVSTSFLHEGQTHFFFDLSYSTTLLHFGHFIIKSDDAIAVIPFIFC